MGLDPRRESIARDFTPAGLPWASSTFAPGELTTKWPEITSFGDDPTNESQSLEKLNNPRNVGGPNPSEFETEAGQEDFYVGVDGMQTVWRLDDASYAGPYSNIMEFEDWGLSTPTFFVDQNGTTLGPYTIGGDSYVMEDWANANRTWSFGFKRPADAASWSNMFRVINKAERTRRTIQGNFFYNEATKTGTLQLADSSDTATILETFTFTFLSVTPSELDRETITDSGLKGAWSRYAVPGRLKWCTGDGDPDNLTGILALQRYVDPMYSGDWKWAIRISQINLWEYSVFSTTFPVDDPLTPRHKLDWPVSSGFETGLESGTCTTWNEPDGDTPGLGDLKLEYSVAGDGTMSATLTRYDTGGSVDWSADYEFASDWADFSGSGSISGSVVLPRVSGSTSAPASLTANAATVGSHTDGTPDTITNTSTGGWVDEFDYYTRPLGFMVSSFSGLVSPEVDFFTIRTKMESCEPQQAFPFYLVNHREFGSDFIRLDGHSFFREWRPASPPSGWEDNPLSALYDGEWGAQWFEAYIRRPELRYWLGREVSGNLVVDLVVSVKGASEDWIVFHARKDFGDFDDYANRDTAALAWASGMSFANLTTSGNVGTANTFSPNGLLRGTWVSHSGTLVLTAAP